MNLISLGSDCCVTYQLEKYGYRKAAFPFDWIRISLEDAIQLIQNHCKDMMEDLYYVRTSINYKFAVDNYERIRKRL